MIRARKKRSFLVESLERREAPSGAVIGVTDLGGKLVTTPSGTAHVNNAAGGIDAPANPGNTDARGCYDGAFVVYTPSYNFNVNTDHCPPGQM